MPGIACDYCAERDAELPYCGNCGNYCCDAHMEPDSDWMSEGRYKCLCIYCAEDEREADFNEEEGDNWPVDDPVIDVNFEE